MFLVLWPEGRAKHGVDVCSVSRCKSEPWRVHLRGYVPPGVLPERLKKALAHLHAGTLFMMYLIFSGSQRVSISDEPTLCFDYQFSKQRSSRPESLPRIFYHGFDFVCQRVKRNSFKYWRCSRYTITGCRGRAILEYNGGLRLNEGHNHDPLSHSDMLNMYFISRKEAMQIVEYLLKK